jgi:hypothetical protein
MYRGLDKTPLFSPLHWSDDEIALLKMNFLCNQQSNWHEKQI